LGPKQQPFTRPTGDTSDEHALPLALRLAINVNVEEEGTTVHNQPTLEATRRRNAEAEEAREECKKCMPLEVNRKTAFEDANKENEMPLSPIRNIPYNLKQAPLEEATAGSEE
jgi:hypothetical protein